MLFEERIIKMSCNNNNNNNNNKPIMFRYKCEKGIKVLVFAGGAELQQVVVNGTRATVEHLQPDSMYTFYLLAYNSKGSSEQSDRVTLATSPIGM